MKNTLDLCTINFAQKCVSKEEQQKIYPIDDKALGRNFQLGSMYDAR